MRLALVVQCAFAGRSLHCVRCYIQALGNHLLDILTDERANAMSIVEPVKDETKKKELKTTDDEEDFMDEGQQVQSWSSLAQLLLEAELEATPNAHLVLFVLTFVYPIN